MIKKDIQTREIIGAIREITSITKTFCCTYEKADGKIRKKLYELRSSWEGIFSRTRLYDLDIQVHWLDPTWPIRMPNITPDKKSSPNINTRENKRRFNRAMIVGSYIKKYNEGMYALDTLQQVLQKAGAKAKTKSKVKAKSKPSQTEPNQTTPVQRERDLTKLKQNSEQKKNKNKNEIEKEYKSEKKPIEKINKKASAKANAHTGE